jgi:hypothetical protein
MSTGSRFIENTVSATVFHGPTGCFGIVLILGVFAQETYHDNEDFTQNNFRSSFRELTFFDGTRYCDHGIDGYRVRRGVQCIAIKDRERRSSVYIPFNQTVVDRGKMSSRFIK